MLRSGILLLLALVIVTVSSIVDDRKKRQSSPRIAFPTDGPNKLTFFEFGEERLVQLTSVNPQDTSVTRIGEMDIVNCDLGTDSVSSPSLPAINSNDIMQCANISASNAGFVTDIFKANEVVEFNGPGQLYSGPDMVLFIADTASPISTLIEASRGRFPPALPSLDVEIVRRRDQLVLNLDNLSAGSDMPPATTTDVLELLGSRCREVAIGQSVDYRNNQIRVREGITVVDSVSNIAELQSVLEQTIAGQRCNVLDRDVMERMRFLPGPGYFCNGQSASNMDDMAAFFTNSTSVTTMIVETLINEQFRCAIDVDGPSLEGSFTPNVGEVLVRLNGDVVVPFPEGSVIEKDSNGVQVRDRFSNILQSFACPDTGITLSLYHLNAVMIFGPTDTLSPLAAPPGGIMTVFNADDCALFAYPSRASLLTSIINMCRSRSMTTPPPPVVFTSRSDGLGGSSLLANGVPILTSSTAMSFQIGRDQSVQYAGGVVTIRSTSSPGSAPLNSFSGIDTFTANTAINRLITSRGSANNAFSGAGTLYVDSDGRAFFTNNPDVSNLIANSVNNVPPQRVDIIPRMVGNRTTTSLQIGGISFFDFPSPDNCMDIESNEGFSYTNGMVRVDTAMLIPASSTLSYFNLERFLQVSGGNVVMNFTNLQGLFVGDPNGGSSRTIMSNMMFAGGGILYLGDGAFYWPWDRVPTNVSVIQFLESVDVSSIDDGFARPINAEICSTYDGTRVRMFNGSALSLMPGPGLLCISGDSCFFTNDQNLIQMIPEVLSQLMPPSTIYNEGTGDVSLVSSGGEPIASFSVGSPTLRAPGGRLMFGGGNITTGNNFIAGDIMRLTVFDGFRTTVINSPDSANFAGGGLLVIDEEAGTAFYTTNNRIAEDITDTISNAMITFSRPDIPDSEPDELRSKLNEINTGFGQLLTVFEGANVNLRCDAGNANPAATITFSMRSNFTEDDPFVPLTNSSDFMFTVNGANDITLNIVAINLGEVEFRCDASNPVGAVSRTTRIRVRPQEPPVIDNSFFSGRASPGEQVVTARSEGNELTIFPIVEPTTPGSPTIDDTSQLVSRVTIGCKANGRPKADITWMVSESGTAAVEVDIGSSEANVTEPRQGQSLLTVLLDNSNPVCFRYICIAENGAGMVEGSAQVCPRRFDTEDSSPIESDCSATCGIGVLQVQEALALSVNGTLIDGSSRLPPGLVKSQVRFCEADIRTCPVVTFEFMVGELSNCTTFCGDGIQTRDVECVRLIDDAIQNETVSDSECIMRGMMKPDEVLDCDPGPCPVYVDRGFGDCSRSCRGGTRMRDLDCLMPVINPVTGAFTFFGGDIVELEICFRYSLQVRPLLSEECNFDVPCPVRYFPEAYGECNEFSCQVRRVFCAQFDPSDPTEAWPANETDCEAQGLKPPTSVRSCGGGVCEFGDWSVTQNGMCSEQCGPGLLGQTVVCVNSTDPGDAVIEDGFCDVALRPDDVVPCFLRNCPEICLSEPFVCPFLRRLRMCKTERLRTLTQECCISCPFQASPIPPLETMEDAVTTDDASP